MRGNRDRGNRARINEALHAGEPRSLEQIPRAGDVGFVDLLRVPRPQPVIRGHVKHAGNALDCAIERRQIPQVAVDSLHRKPRQSPQIARGPGEHTDGIPRATNCRATWLPRKPVAPVTSVVIEPANSDPGRRGFPARREADGGVHCRATAVAALPHEARAAHLAAHLPLEHFPSVAHLAVRAENRGRLEPDVHHAIRTARIVSRTIFRPVRFLDRSLIGIVMLVRDQVAGTLPAAGIERRRAPGGAVEFAFAAEKIQIDRRNHQIVFAQKLERGAEFVAGRLRAT